VGGTRGRRAPVRPPAGASQGGSGRAR
jgi:hypothetical protein